MNLNDLFNEEKVRLDPKCWTGKKIGNPKTKMKGGTRVNNCVPAESVDQSVAEGLSDTIYPNAEVIKSKNGKPVGEIYQDGNSWGAFHYRADRGYDFIDSREEAIEALKDLHQETGRSRPDYTVKGVMEMDKSQTPPGRDGSNDPDAGKKEYTAKATTAKKVAKDGEKILNKELNKKQGVTEGLAQDEAEEDSGWRAEFVNEINYNTFEVKLTNTRSKESANFIVRPVDMVSYGPTLSIETMDVHDLQTGQTESWTNDDPAPEGPIAYAISGLFYDDKQLQKKLQNIIDTHDTKGQDMMPGLEKRRSIGQEVDADAYIDSQEKTQAAMAKMKKGVAEKLGDNRPKLGSKRDSGKSIRKWRSARGLDETGVAEEAPPGDKAERMVKHIKKSYAKDGKITDKEKGIAYATAWKAHNAGKVEEAQYDRGDYYNARMAGEYGKGMSASLDGGGGDGPGRGDIHKGQTKHLPADPFGRASGDAPQSGKGKIYTKALPDEMDEGEQQKGADYRDPPEADYGDDYQDMVARVKKLAGLGPLKTVYDPAKRVYRNVPTAVQPKK